MCLGLSLLDRPLVPLRLNVASEPKEEGESLLACPELQRVIGRGNCVPGTILVLPNMCWNRSAQNVQSLISGMCFINEGLECSHHLTVTSTELVLWFGLVFLQEKCSDISKARVNIHVLFYHTRVSFCPRALFLFN